MVRPQKNSGKIATSVADQHRFCRSLLHLQNEPGLGSFGAMVCSPGNGDDVDDDDNDDDDNDR